jgi:shikimate kinase
MRFESPTSFEWTTDAVPLARLAMGVDELAARIHAAVSNWEVDGLGPARGFCVRMSSGRAYGFVELELVIRHNGTSGLLVCVDAGDLAALGPDALLAELVDAITISSSGIAGVADEASRTTAAEIASRFRPPLRAQRFTDPANSSGVAGDRPFEPCMSLLFLIGYRGSGKTTVGRLVADRLGWAFVDADALLEERHGRTIRDIFAAEGEAGFREKEAATLADLCTHTNCVIATGGGIVLRDENRKLLKQHGVVAWLTADPATLVARIQADPSTAERRPHLAGGGLAEIEQLLAVREPLYRACADVVVPVGALSPEHAADAILAACPSLCPKSSG